MLTLVTRFDRSDRYNEMNRPARKPPAPRMRETVLVSACIEYLTLRGFFIWRQNQGALRTEYKGRRSFTRFAGVDGISDIIGMTPSGQFLAVECKIAPNKATPEQLQFLDRVRSRGGVGLLVYTIDELMNATKGL